MKYLKLKNPNQLYGILHGQVRGNNRLELLEDINGDHYIHEGIKDEPIWAEFKNAFNSMEVVDTIQPKEYDI